MTSAKCRLGGVIPAVANGVNIGMSCGVAAAAISGGEKPWLKRSLAS